jgi:hypothetical protein
VALGEMTGDRFEVGSEFHWVDEWPTGGDPPPWVQQASFFATGRGALARLAAEAGAGRRLHLPSYFCRDAAAAASAHMDLAFYRHLPGGAPDFSTLSPRTGDWVVAANLFGVDDGEAWKGWRPQHDVVLVEDHTHDPLSHWAYGNDADFAFASLRKTLPLPDGAVLWSPRGHRLPVAGRPVEGSEAKLQAMLIKRAFLNGANLPRGAFRELQIAGERALEDDCGGCAMNVSKELIQIVRAWSWRERRTQNVRRFLDRLTPLTPAGVAPLFSAWPAGSAPFAAVLVCADESTRESLRRFMIDRNIFVAVHWPQPAGSDPLAAEAADLSRRLLTVPLDQRYGNEEVDRVADTVLALTRQMTCA